jgi:asparaginyl-tRNA synthetase
MKRTEIAKVLGQLPIGDTITVMGWVRAFRSNRFIVLNDGSGPGTLQVVIDPEQLGEELVKKIKFHACLSVTGQLAESQGAGQKVELLAQTVTILGECNPDEYPLQPKVQTM